MKIPLIWLKDYVDIKKSPDEIAKSFTALGLMLDKPIANNVLDLEHRFDRSDWLSVIGCARDLAAMEGLKLKYPKSYLQKGKPATKETLVEIKVDCPDLVYRFNTRVFKNIKVKESPQWLKERLEAYGMPTINNIVDITNFVMVEYGNPMHAQDLAKFQKREIVLRRAKSGEKITTLDGTEVTLDPETLVLTQNNKPIVIGGVVGGIDTAVDTTTTEIILDAGNYNQTSVRKTARKIKIQNESALRFEKFLHPHGDQVAIERTTELILELAGGEYYENVDYYPNPKPLKQMTLTLARLAKISGMDFEMPRVKEILTAIDYKILAETKNSLRLEIPYFRTDIEVEDDIASDVLRINNFENIPLQLIEAAPPKEITEPIYKYEETLRDTLVNLGLHEFITDPFVPNDPKNTKRVVLLNSQNSEQNALRTNIYETLQKVIDMYKKHNIKETGLFEIGKVYEKIGRGDRHQDYKEIRQLEVIYSNENKSTYEISKETRKNLAGLLWNLGITDTSLKPKEPQTEMQEVEIWQQDKQKLGELRYDSFTLNTEELVKIKPKPKRIVDNLTFEPTEDISLIVEMKAPFGPIYDFIKGFDKAITNVTAVEEYMDKSLGQDKKAVLVRVEFETAEDIAQIKERLISHLESKYKVNIRK